MDRDEVMRASARDMTEADHALHRARYMVERCKIEADGHRLVTLGAHTGHAYKVRAFCENEQVASEIAAALARARVKE